jgi:hypothetical protein
VGQERAQERPVNLTDESRKALVGDLTDAVTKTRQLEMLEQFQSFARQEVELTRAREELTRKDAEIAGLRQHIGTLNGFIANMSSPGVPAYNPYNNGGPAVTTQAMPAFDSRYAAPMPPLTAPVPAWTPAPVLPADVPVPPAA